MISKKILGITFLVQAVTAISTFGLFVLSSRFVGAEGRGMISLFIANRTIVQLVSEVIFGPGYIYIAQKAPFKTLFTTGILWSFASSIVIPVLLWMTHIQNTDLFLLLIINSFLFALHTGISYQLQAVQYSTGFNSIQFIQSLSSLAIAWCMLQQEASTSTFCIALACSYVLSCLTGVYFLWNYYRGKTTHTAEQTTYSILNSFKTGLTAQYSNFLNFLNTRIGFYLIYIIIGDVRELGVFAAAATLSESVWLISHTLATWLYPKIASSVHSDETIETTLSYAYFSFWYSFAALLVLVAIPENILLFMFGDSFTGIKQYILLLIPGTLILAYGKIFWNYFSGTGRFYINNYASLVSFIVAIATSIPLMYYYAIDGIAVSTSISYIVYTVLLIAVFVSKNNLSWKRLIPSFRLLP